MLTHDEIEALGGCAGLLTTLSFVPQVLKVFLERDTSALSLRMYLAFTLGVMLWIVYGVYRGSVAVVISNCVTLALAGAVLVMKLYLDHGFFRLRR